MGVDLKLTYRLYQKLLLIAPEIGAIGDTVSDVADGLPLYCTVLEIGRDFRRLELGQRWALPSGQGVLDVVFEVNVFADWELAEAVSYQYCSTTLDAYPVDGEPPKLSIHRRINRLLENWLDVLTIQGHRLNSKGTAIPLEDCSPLA